MMIKEFGREIVRILFSNANTLVFFAVLSTSGGIGCAFFLGVAPLKISESVRFGFVMCIPIMAVSLIISYCARESISLLTYTARFNYSNSVDAILSLYAAEETSSLKRFLVVVYAVFISTFYVFNSAFITMGLFLLYFS